MILYILYYIQIMSCQRIEGNIDVNLLLNVLYVVYMDYK